MDTASVSSSKRTWRGIRRRRGARGVHAGASPPIQGRRAAQPAGARSIAPEAEACALPPSTG